MKGLLSCPSCGCWVYKLVCCFLVQCAHCGQAYDREEPCE